MKQIKESNILYTYIFVKRAATAMETGGRRKMEFLKEDFFYIFLIFFLIFRERARERSAWIGGQRQKIRDREEAAFW